MARGNSAKILITASDKTKAAFKSVKDRMGRVQSAVFSMQSAIAGAAGAAGFGMLINNAIKSGDVLAKTADKLGLTTEALAGLRHAAEQTGVASNTMDMALQRMTRRIAEAARGTGEAKDAIKQLGLNAQELNAMGPEKAFQKIAGAMEQVQNKGEKIRLGFKLFDSEGVALVNTLALGEEGLKGMAAEADALGISLSRVDAARLEEVANATDRMGKAFTGVGNNIAIEFSSLMVLAANNVMGVAIEGQKGINGLSDSMVNFAESAAIGTAGVAGAMSAPINSILRVAQSAWDGFNRMPAWMQEVGVLGAILGGKKGVLAITAIAAVANKLVTIKVEATAKAYQRIGNAMDNNRKALESVNSDKVPDWMQTSRIEALQKRYAVLGVEMTTIQALMTHGASASSTEGSTLFDGGAEGDAGRKKVTDWFAELRAQKKKIETASLTTKPISSGLSLPTGITGGGQTEAEKEAEKIQKVIDLHQAKFARLADMASVAAMDEESRVIDALDKKINALDAEYEFLVENDGKNLEREQAYNDARASIVETGEAKINSIRANTQGISLAAEKKHTDVATQYKTSLVKNAIGLMSQLGAKSKAFQTASIIAETAYAAASIWASTAMAAAAALAPPPLGLGPIAGAGLAATITAAGATSAALTVAGGVARLSGGFGGAQGVNTAGSSAAIPSQVTSPGTPVTQTPTAQPPAQQITIIIDGVTSVDHIVNNLVPVALRDQITNNDLIIIDPRSRQAAVQQAA